MKAVSMNLSIFFISGMPEYAREYSGISSIQLCGGQFDKLVESIGQTVDVASSGSCESRLSATASLDQLGSFADVLSGIPAFGDKVIRIHQHETRLAFAFDSSCDDGVLDLLLNHHGGIAEHVLVRIGNLLDPDEIDPVHGFTALLESLGETGSLLPCEFVGLLLVFGVLADQFLD